MGPGPGPRVEPAPLSADPGPAGAAGNSCGLAPARGWLPPARSCPARDRWASGCQCRSTGRGLMRDASRCAVSRRSESAGPGAGFSHAVAPWGSQAWGCFEFKSLTHYSLGCRQCLSRPRLSRSAGPGGPGDVPAAGRSRSTPFGLIGRGGHCGCTVRPSSSAGPAPPPGRSRYSRDSDGSHGDSV